MAKENKKEVEKASAKVLPYNTEAEQSVLGAALISDDACLGVMSKLEPQDFYGEVHQRIFAAMKNLFQRNVPVDYITLTDELEKQGKLESCGGAEYIMDLSNNTPSASRWPSYSEIVKRCSVNRQLIAICEKITRKSFNGDADSLGEAEKFIFELAETGQVSELEGISEYLNIVMKKFEEINKEGGQIRGIPSGFYAIDEITHGWQNSDLIIIAARPAVGKTSLAMNFVVNAALKKKNCAVFSLEMSKAQLAQRMLCSVAGVDMTRALSAKLTPQDWTKLFKATNTLNECNIFIDDSTMNSPSDILSKCRKLKREHGLDLIMIDYLQLMYSDKKTDNRQSEVSDISRRMKILAKEIDVPVLLLSQLSRAVENRQGKKPVLSDLRETGAIEQDADIVMFIHKPEEMQGVEREGEASDYIAEIIFAKHRNGKIGSVNIGWKGSRVSFVNLPRDGEKQSLMDSEPPEISRQPQKIDKQVLDSVFADDDPPFEEDLPPAEDYVPPFDAGDAPPPDEGFDPNLDMFE